MNRTHSAAEGNSSERAIPAAVAGLAAIALLAAALAGSPSSSVESRGVFDGPRVLGYGSGV